MSTGASVRAQSSSAITAGEQRLPPYPDYQDSADAWLGKAPGHWPIKRLRFCLSFPTRSEISDLAPEIRVSFVPMEAVHEYGGMSLTDARALEDIGDGYTYFRNGDVVVAKITPCFENGKGSLAEGLENGIGLGTTELHVLRPGPRLDSRFLFYTTISHHFRRLGASEMYGAGGQKRVPERFIRDLRLPIPSLTEQRAIAAFLDHETVRIDELIAKKERLIELLQEKRTALISHAVTKGLNPDAPMKDSGIEWLGRIPEQWRTERNAWLYREINERSTTGEEDLLTVSHITGVSLRSEKQVYMFMAESLEDYKVCHAGDLIINTMWAWMGALGTSPQHGVVSPSYNVYRISDRSALNPRYVDYLYRTPRHIVEIIRYSKGVWSSRLRLYPREFLMLHTPIPPVREQEAIVEFLDAETRRMQDISSAIRTAILKLHEYRSALISAAVTGKIDVRDERVLTRL